MLNKTLEYPESLPISAKRELIISTIRQHQVTIICGETGSGKTTQIPKMCLEAGLGTDGLIGCTQPRRIAALSVSRRIAQELGVAWGRDVGCKIRFSDRTDRHTQIKVMTDGILLAEIRGDPLLKAYQTIIIDEAHERSLTIDFILGYLKQLRAKRPDLKIVITSATIDTELFSSSFDNAPIIEVSGRLYPVDIRYAPLDSADEQDSPTYVDAAINTTLEITRHSERGDILVFMPTERDIHETRERLAGALGSSATALPLMGSLPASEQERIFAPSDKRKVIISTNIAETSLTIPGIRYVIDTGLARISRYNPRSRAKRLPIEPIAQSSANQRAGRAGRIEDGICYRLYSLEDLNQRPNFTDPEIVRSNLAEVILRMKAFNLGAIEEFPFLNPPDERAIRSGYTLLFELGALDKDRQLTPLGRELAKLPVDPTIGRILIQARRERCLNEALIIGAALTIQDPRERPLEKRDKADQTHASFNHPDSDFLTLLNIWQAYSSCIKQQQGRSSAQRAFCKNNFLSWMRMREWSELISELTRATNSQTSEPRPITGLKRSDPLYKAIHRSIATGFIGQIAIQSDGDQYRGLGNRQLTIFPASSLARKYSADNKRPVARSRERKHPHKQNWIVASEIVETTRAFVRRAARIEPSWIEDLIAHTAKKSYLNPAWDPRRGSVTAREHITLGGLTVADRCVSYGEIAPQDALEIFIRSTLIVDPSPFSYPWIIKNRQLTDKVATILARSGKLGASALLSGASGRMELEERLVSFYRELLPGVYSAQSLERKVANLSPNEGARYLISTKHLLGDDLDPLLDSELPDTIDVAGTAVALRYRYEPGSDRDGVTIELDPDLAKRIPAHTLDAAIPGLRQQQLAYLMRALPKEHRRQIPSLDETIQAISKDPNLAKLPLIDALERGLKDRHSINLRGGDTSLSNLPNHLRPRIEIRSLDKVLASGRDLNSIVSLLAADSNGSTTTSERKPSWPEARKLWEREDLHSWDFSDLPEEIEVGRVGDVPVYLFPALCQEEHRAADTNAKISIRLLDSQEQAIQHSAKATKALAEITLKREVNDLAKQTKAIDSWPNQILLLRRASDLRDDTQKAALGHIFDSPLSYPPKRQDFDRFIETAKSRLPNLVPRILEHVRTILELRVKLLASKPYYPDMLRDLEQLVPADFILTTPYERLCDLPRYLKGMILRCQRADKDPSRHQERSRELERYQNLLKSDPKSLPPDFKWILEEFKISLFAQELGTPAPISAKRIDKLIHQHGN